MIFLASVEQPSAPCQVYRSLVHNRILDCIFTLERWTRIEANACYFGRKGLSNVVAIDSASRALQGIQEILQQVELQVYSTRYTRIGLWEELVVKVCDVSQEKVVIQWLDHSLKANVSLTSQIHIPKAPNSLISKVP
jgi:hypothetical protein